MTWESLDISKGVEKDILADQERPFTEMPIPDFVSFEFQVKGEHISHQFFMPMKRDLDAVVSFLFDKAHTMTIERGFRHRADPTPSIPSPLKGYSFYIVPSLGENSNITPELIDAITKFNRDGL